MMKVRTAGSSRAGRSDGSNRPTVGLGSASRGRAFFVLEIHSLVRVRVRDRIRVRVRG